MYFSGHPNKTSGSERGRNYASLLRMSWRGWLGIGSVVLVLAATTACGNTRHAGPQAAAGSPNDPDDTPICEDARLDSESGIETCGRGQHQFEHRAQVGAGCSYDPALLDTCNLSDCGGRYAYCAEQDGESVCGYGCGVDADCQKYEICQCQGPGLGGRCVPSECQSDADCQQGNWCSTLRSVCSIKSVYACGLLGDQCHVDEDCAPATPYCLPIPNPRSGGWNRICVETLPCPE